MSNLREVKPRVKTITLNDGVEREIRLTLNALAELEERYGSVDAAFAELDKNSIKAVRCVLWAALLYDDETLTEQQVGRLIDTDCLSDIMDKLGDAMAEAMPEKEDTDGAKPAAQVVEARAVPNA